MLRGLYGRWSVDMPMLALGVDLAKVVPVGPDVAWLDRFRNPHKIFGVEFEIELWANCIRAGIPISRVPEGTTKTPGIQCTSRDAALNLAAAIRADWTRLSGLYTGTCARFISLNRLRTYLDGSKTAPVGLAEVQAAFGSNLRSSPVPLYAERAVVSG